MAENTNRPLFNASGPQLIALITLGDEVALAEAQYRRVPSVRTVAKAAGVVYAKSSTRKPAPAPKPARKTGPGSRGGDPSKWLHGQIALAFGAYGSPAWVAARVASKGVTAKNHAQAAQLLAGQVAKVAKVTGLVPVSTQLVAV